MELQRGDARARDATLDARPRRPADTHGATASNPVMQLKVNAGAPFRLGVRLTNSQEHGLGPAAEGTRRAPVGRRRVSDAKLEAVGKRREESAPPTKPSIAPPTASVLRPLEPLGVESPLAHLERATPTFAYGLVIALAAVALGVGASMTASWGGQDMTWLKSALWILAISTLLFSLSMALLITLSFTRRLRALAAAAERLAHPKSEEMPLVPSRGDAVTSLAHSVTQMSERITRLTAELEQCVEEEQARVDELVRERTRSLARESEDLRRVLGESKGLLSIDRDGRIIDSASAALTRWLGAAPRAAHFWEYFELASSGSGSRFESAWAGVRVEWPSEVSLKRLPKSLAAGGRYFALDYKPVQDAGGNLERVLVLLSDITIPDPDPATPG